MHPSDFLFLFLLSHPFFRDDQQRVDYYFDDGARSALALSGLVADTCRLVFPSLRLLEFASGYGCVTRHLPGALPGASVTGCDIHPEAVEFLQRRLGVPAIVSHSVPERLELPERFDVVFALSFFSHMPKASWGRWLRVLADGVRPGGYLVFTTHGPTSADRLNCPGLDPDGFWFEPLSEQKDLDTGEYGTTVTSPDFVRHRIAENPGLELVASTPGFWWRHQDLYVLRSPS